MLSKEFSTFRRILALFSRIHIHPAYFVVPVLLSIAAAAFEGVGMGLLIPLLQGFFSQDYSFAKETPALGTVISYLPESIKASDKLLFGSLLVFFTIATLLKNILKYTSLVSISYIGLRAAHHMRKVLFTRYLSFGKLYFDSSHIGHHSALLSNFAQHSFAPLMSIGRHINALFSLIAYLVVLTLISWKLTLFTLPLLFLLHVAVQQFIHKLRHISKHIVASITEISQKTIEILSTITLVQASNTGELEKDRFTEISNKQAQHEFHKSAFQHLLLPLQEILTLCAILLLFSFMLYLMVQEGSSTAPSFIVYFYLVMNAASKFGVLTTFRSGLANVEASVEKVEEVLSDDDKFFVPSGSTTFDGLKDGIEFRDMTFTFPNGNDVLNNLSFSVAKGSMTAIVGPTGAGKTTIINVLLRFYDCPERSLFVDGEDIRSYDTISLRKHMGIVSQETLLLHDSLRNNITYGLDDVTEEQLQSAIEHARLSEFVKELPDGLDTMIGDRGVKLSGGEKQRVSIARALLKNADILVLDEATSSLDSRTERMIQEAIDDAVVGRTSVVIAHRLSTIKHADKIVVIEGGKVVEEGTLDELLGKKGVFHTLWEEQKFT